MPQDESSPCLDSQGLLGWKIRYMQPRDLAGVVWIDEDAFRGEAWLGVDFDRQCRTPRIRALVATCDDGTNTAVAAYLLWRSHFASIHLIRLAVAPTYRRRGVASELVARAQAVHGQPRVTVDVPERQLAGQLFFRALGFRSVNTIPEAFTATAGDLYRMERRYPRLVEGSG